MKVSAVDLVRNPDLLPDGWSCRPSPGSSLAELLGDGRGRSFETSGSRTGCPTTWYRSPEQLAAEASITLGVLGGNSIDQVITTVEPTSLYGYALGVLTPVALGVPVRHQRVLLGDLALEPGHTLVVTVAPGWCTGPAIPPLPPGCTVTFVHAGSLLPPRARTLVDAHGETSLIELFGATEVGLIAHRVHEAHVGRDRDPWTVVDDVTMVVAHDQSPGETPLVVRSPRIASPGSRAIRRVQHTLGDWVLPVDERSFRFDGRRERLAKPGGRNINLDRLEATIGTLTGFRLQLACVTALDPIGGEVVVVEVEGDQTVALELEDLLRRSASALPVRPHVLAVDQILRSPMGKPRPLRLAA